MRKTTVKTRLIALTLVLISIISTISIGAISTSAAVTDEGLHVKTYEEMIKESISTYIDDKIPSALKPLFGMLSEDFFGDFGSSETDPFAEIDSQLEDLKAEMSEGFDKVLSEMDKNNKMRNAVDALARAEFLAETIMENSRAEMANEVFSLEVKDLTPQQQREIVEINADIVNSQIMTELYSNLKLAKEYMSTGYIDTDYRNVFDVYYSYMKKQSMFCGEAANKSEPFWEVMKESYAKSCLSLLYGLEQQKALYLLSESTPTDEISQEAIDAAAVAKTFGTLSVLESRIANVNKDATQLLDKYNQMVENARAEATTFINKDTTYIELNPQIGNVNISNCKSYNDYVANNSFEAEGITENLYNKMVKRFPNFSFDYGTTLVNMKDVPYNNFINNSGRCTYNVVKSDASGTCFIPHNVELKEIIDKVFSTVMIDMKAEQFNHKNKLSNENVSKIIDYVTENYSHDTVASYLESVGFNFGDLDVTAETNVLLPTGDFEIDRWSDRIDNKGKLCDVNSLNKKCSDFKNTVDVFNPTGKILFFENATDTIDLTVHADSMDGRVYKGVYTIEGKLIDGYGANNKPKSSYYEKVFEMHGTDEINMRLPSNLDMSTVKITLGYEGLCASSNHKSVCSYNLSDLKNPCSEITLSMEGYTKVWLGYGVHANISCDGVVVATGEG